MTSSREQFDRQAAHYDQQWADWNEGSLRWMLEQAQARATDRLLDVATGSGFTALGFASRVASVVGVDVSAGMLEQARRRAAGVANARFEPGSAESLPFADGSFELVTCRIAPHHFHSVPAFLREAHRVLVPGGRLLVADTVVPDGRPELGEWQNAVERWRDPSHQRNHTPAEWRGMVTEAGFRIEALSEDCAPEGVTLGDWLAKAGCAGEAAAQVRRMFAEAPAETRRVFSIRGLEVGELGFAWLRVVFAAVR